MATRDQYNTQRQELLQSIGQSNLLTENQAKLREEMPPAANEATADADLENFTKVLKTLAGKLKKFERQAKKQDPALKGGLNGNGGKLIPDDVAQQVQEREEQAAKVEIIEEDDDLMLEKIEAPEQKQPILRKTFDEIWDVQGKMPRDERKNGAELQRLTEAEAQEHLAHCKKFIRDREENRRKRLQGDVKREVEEVTRELGEKHDSLVSSMASVRAELTTQANKLGEARDDMEAFRKAINDRLDGLDKSLNELKEQVTKPATPPAAPPAAVTPPSTRRPYLGYVVAVIAIAATLLVAVLAATGTLDLGLTTAIPSEPVIVLDEQTKLIQERTKALEQRLQQ